MTQSTDGWGATSIFGRDMALEPPADPATGMFPPISLLGDEFDAVGEADADQWSTTTFVGKGHRRAARGHAVEATHSAADLFTDAPAPPAEPDAAAAPDAAVDHEVAARVPPAGGARPAAQTGSPAQNLLASSRTMAIASLASRILGFVRNIAVAAALGAGVVSETYNTGNSFPNMVYELLLGGVLSSVLIPLIVFAQEHDADGGESYIQRLLSISTAVLGVATLVAVAAAPILATGSFSPGPGRDLTTIMASLLLPEIFFYGLAALFVAVLNSHHVYAPGAWAPVLNNVVVLVTVGVFLALPGPKTLDPTTITTTQILVIGIGTTLGIVAQALAVIPALRRIGFRWKWRFRGPPEQAGRLRNDAALTGWIVAYVALSQVGIYTLFAIANRHRGSTIFTYADLLFQMPYGILVVSLLTALMPRMSRAAVRGHHDEVISDLGLGARLSAIAMVPISAGLIALAPLFTTIFFAYGQTSAVDARQIGVNLALAAFGLLPFAVVMLQLRVFYAMRDGRTPTIINAFMVGTKLTLLIIADQTLHTRGVVEMLNFATSASYLVGAIVGHRLLTGRFGPLGFRAVAVTTAKIGAASAVAATVAYLVTVPITHSLGNARLGSLLALVSGATAGVVVLVIGVSRLGLPEIEQLRRRFGRESRAA